MKKIIICLLLITWSVASFSQQTTTSRPPLTRMDYLKKSKKQNTTAWILLGSGIGMSIGGYAIAGGPLGGIGGNPNDNPNKGVWLVYLGGATTLASIPLFIAASRNKRLAIAATTFFKMETTPVIKQSLFAE